MPKYEEYETERLFLRPTSLQDSSFIFELLNTPKWLQFIGDRNIETIADAEAYIQEKMLPVLEKHGFGNFTVIRKTDGAKMGCCGLYDREGIEGFDLGFAFLPAYEGLGFAFESASKIKEVAISELKFTQISAITNRDNTGSQKLLEKLNFQFAENINLPKAEESVMLYKWESN